MNNNIKVAIIIIVVILAIALLVTFYINNVVNKAIILEDKITAAQSEIETREKDRANIVPDIIDCIREHNKYEAIVLMRVFDARGADTDELAEHIITLIKNVAENESELKNSNRYKQLMSRWITAENLIVDSRNNYNACVDLYNRYIVKFPNKQILDMQDYKYKDYVVYED